MLQRASSVRAAVELPYQSVRIFATSIPQPGLCRLVKTPVSLISSPAPKT